jgi:hypothetical protein
MEWGRKSCAGWLRVLKAAGFRHLRWNDAIPHHWKTEDYEQVVNSTNISRDEVKVDQALVSVHFNMGKERITVGSALISNMFYIYATIAIFP